MILARGETLYWATAKIEISMDFRKELTLITILNIAKLMNRKKAKIVVNQAEPSGKRN